MTKAQIDTKFLPFEEARKFARSLNFLELVQLMGRVTRNVA